MSRTYIDRIDIMQRTLPATLSVTQLDFLEYLQLSRAKRPIRTRECSVRILGSKCSICKREFKCITDTQKHMTKKHKYLKRKSDDKLVRIRLKMGKETFCDNTICKKYLVTPRRKSVETSSSLFKSKKDAVSTTLFACKLPEVTSIDSLLKPAVPLSSALTDIISLDQNASFRNGQVYKERPLDSRVPDISTLDENDSDLTWDVNCASPSGSESNTVVYVSDVEVDLSQLYEDVKPKIPEVINLIESDVEDADTMILPNSSGKAELDTCLDDLEDLSNEDLVPLDDRMETDILLDDTILWNELMDERRVRREPKKAEAKEKHPSDEENILFSRSTTIERSPMEGDYNKKELRQAKAAHAPDTFQTTPNRFQPSRARSHRLDSSETIQMNSEDDLALSEESYDLTVSNSVNLEGLEEGDQDVLIIEDNVEQSQHDLADFLEAAVMKYVEKVYPDTNNNNSKKFSPANQQLKNSSVFEHLKNLPQFNEHMKKALERLGISVASSSFYQ